MTRHHIILLTLCATVATLVGSPAVSVAAGPLLSGYGGPGAGQQAILGSALLNGSGPGGGGGSTGSPTGGEGSLTGESSGGSSAPAATPAKTTTKSTKISVKRAPKGSKSSASKSTGAGGGGRIAYPGRSQGGSVQTVADDNVAVGLSGADLLLIVLAIGVLALTGVATRRLARLQR